MATIKNIQSPTLSLTLDKLHRQGDQSRAAALQAIEEQIEAQNARQLRQEGNQLGPGPITVYEPEPFTSKATYNFPPQEGYAKPPTFWENALTRARALQKEQAKQLVGAARRGGGNTKVVLESIPIPGGIGTPLLILLLLFLALLPANGHTRLIWLWLTIIGNARVSKNKAVGLTVKPLTIYDAQGHPVGSSGDYSGGGPGLTSGDMSPEPVYSFHDPFGLRPNSYVEYLGGGDGEY